MSKPNKNEYTSFFQGYILLVKAESLEKARNMYSKIILKYWDSIPEQKWTYSYASKKWTLKQVFQHIIDTERILAYRALCIVRGEKQTLNEFDQDKYANSGDAFFRNIEDLKTEWKLIRESNDIMFRSFTKKDLSKVGVVGKKNLSVNAIAYIIYGHVLHHINVINEKYL